MLTITLSNRIIRRSRNYRKGDFDIQ